MGNRPVHVDAVTARWEVVRVGMGLISNIYSAAGILEDLPVSLVVWVKAFESRATTLSTGEKRSGRFPPCIFLIDFPG